MGGNQSNFYFVDFEFPKKPAQQTVRKTIGIKQPIQKNGMFYQNFVCYESETDGIVPDRPFRWVNKYWKTKGNQRTEQYSVTRYLPAGHKSGSARSGRSVGMACWELSADLCYESSPEIHYAYKYCKEMAFTFQIFFSTRNHI